MMGNIAAESMDASSPCTTELKEKGRVLVVTLNHPPDNVITPETFRCLAAALDVLEADTGPDLAILTGEGQVFSKGFDVAVIRSYLSSAEHGSSLLVANDVCSRLAEATKPVIAAINGACLGAGLELAMACHFRLAVEKARLGLPELSRGLIPGLGGIHRLVRLVGRAKALELIVVGDFVTAEEAHRLGLVHRVLSRADFIQRVLSFARAILSVDQALVREAVRLVGLAAAGSDHDCAAETILSILRLMPPASKQAGGPAEDRIA
jgi:enoyl-CoA hydratase